MGKQKCKICGHDFESGKDSLPNDSVCPGCAQKIKINSILAASEKSRDAYNKLACFLGFFGVHNFYTGYYTRGILKIILTAGFVYGLMLSKQTDNQTVVGIATALIWIIIILSAADLFIKKDAKGLPMGIASGKDIGISVVILICIYAIIGGMFLPAIGSSREKSRRITCTSNLSKIGTSLIAYADNSAGFFPNRDNADGLKMLMADAYIKNDSFLICPSARARPEKPIFAAPAKDDYIYFGGLKTSDAQETILALDKIGNHSNYINILYVNGKVLGTYSAKIKTYESILRYIYNDDLTDQVRLKQLEKAKQFDRANTILKK